MKGLLLDANLSWRLAKPLAAAFGSCVHVDSVGLTNTPTDTAIWEYAKREGLIIVTNDDDFSDFARIKGFPPKVVLLRTGNQSNNYLLDILLKHKADILSLEGSSEAGLLEIL
ncbi:MAG: hypothetical protein EOO08_12330 [Chitinophagaceae bacterium]|nr:MAG: hypothetical protein EOO08_12330 [Chitinophagaceae bacterium]